MVSPYVSWGAAHPARREARGRDEGSERTGHLSPIRLPAVAVHGVGHHGGTDRAGGGAAAAAGDRAGPPAGAAAVLGRRGPDAAGRGQADRGAGEIAPQLRDGGADLLLRRPAVLELPGGGAAALGHHPG